MVGLSVANAGEGLPEEAFAPGSGLEARLGAPVPAAAEWRSAALTGALLYGATSFLCGISPSIEILVIVRILQGMADAEVRIRVNQPSSRSLGEE